MTKPQCTGEHENPDVPAEARHFTASECEEKLAELEVKYGKARKAIEVGVAQTRSEICVERKRQLAELATAHDKAMQVWQNMRDCLKMEGGDDQAE